MTTVAAFYTAQSLVVPCTNTFSELLPSARLINIVDDHFISDVIRSDGVNAKLAKRLLCYFQAAEMADADYIFSTCSSIGDLIEGARGFLRIPVVRIDAAMAMQAVTIARRIAVLATLPTTLGPTVRLVRRHAQKQGAQVEIVEGLAKGAFQALQAGDTATHNALILETAKRIGNEVDVFLLAQGSMSPMEGPVRDATGKPVLTSLRSGLIYLREVIEHGADPNT